MTDKESAPRDRKQMMLIGLGVVVVILVGVIVGFIVSGGLDDPVAAPSTTVPTATSTPSPTRGSTSTLPSATTIPGQLSVPASEDTYVNSGQPEEINGLEDVLEIENDPPENKQGLVRFVVDGIPEGETIEFATLRLFVVADSDDAITVHLVEGDWNQNETTGANAPAVGEQVGVIPPGAEDGSTVEVDLTQVVQGAGTYDFYIVSPGDDSAEYATIESGTSPPLLIVDWGSGTAGAAPGSVIELSGDPVILAGAGDIADCAEEGDTATAELLDQVVEENAETIVLTTGDNAYPSGATEDFVDCYGPTWGRHLDRTRPTPGNHDYDTDAASGYFGYFGDAAGSPGEGYYSYEAGDWQVLALNSNCEEIGGCNAGSPQESWLRQELTDSDAACTLAYWHHPQFSSARVDEADVDALYRALYENDAEVVVTGHDHHYERFAPQDPDGVHDPVRGVRQFIVGTGGKGGSDIGDLAANSEARLAEGFGVLKLALYSDGYEWEMLTDGSGVVDLGIEACH